MNDSHLIPSAISFTARRWLRRGNFGRETVPVRAMCEEPLEQAKVNRIIATTFDRLIEATIPDKLLFEMGASRREDTRGVNLAVLCFE